MTLKITLNEELARRYEVVKEHTGMNDDQNVLAFLISEEYSRIQNAKYHRLFVTRKTYDMAEKAAEAKGETVPQFVEELIDRQTRTPEEGLKHAN
jgi:hypothetical protein